MSIKTIPFGRRAGHTLAEIRALDPAYFRWLVGQDWILEVFDSDDARAHGAIGFVFDGEMMPFGQYRGHLITDIIRQDPGYAETITRQHWAIGPIGAAFRAGLADRGSLNAPA